LTNHEYSGANPLLLETTPFWVGGSFQVSDDKYRQLFVEKNIPTLDMSDLPKTTTGKVNATLEIIVELTSLDYVLQPNIEITRGGNIGTNDPSSDGIEVRPSCLEVNDGAGYQLGVNVITINLADCRYVIDNVNIDGSQGDGIYNQGYDFNRIQMYRTGGDSFLPCDESDNGPYESLYIDDNFVTPTEDEDDDGIADDTLDPYTGGVNNCPFITILSFKVINPDVVENHPGNPSSPRYWNNIIPEDYDIYNNREQDGIQNWKNGYYYPVLPLFSQNRTFTESLGGKIPFGTPNREWNEDDVLAAVTNEQYQDDSLLLNYTSEYIERGVLEDTSGYDNVGMCMNDYRVEYNEQTIEPIKQNRKFTLIRGKQNKAF